MNIKRLIHTLIATSLFTFSAAQAENAVPTSPNDVCPIKIGETLPELSLKNIDGKATKLNELIASKPTVLIFYRGSWCPYCNVHLGELKTIEGDLQALGYQIVAVSPDLPSNLQKSVEKNGLSYQILSDADSLAAQALGLAYKVDAKTYQKLLGYGINLEQASGQTHRQLPVPAAFILDQSGVVKFSFVSPEYKVRVDTSVLLAAAKSAAKK